MKFCWGLRGTSVRRWCTGSATGPGYSHHAWFPALRFRSSVTIGSSSVFPYQFASRYRKVWQRRYGTAVRKRLRKRIRMNGNVMLETRHHTNSATAEAQTARTHGRSLTFAQSRYTAPEFRIAAVSLSVSVDVTFMTVFSQVRCSVWQSSGMQ